MKYNEIIKELQKTIYAGLGLDWKDLEMVENLIKNHTEYPLCVNSCTNLIQIGSGRGEKSTPQVSSTGEGEC